MLEFCNCSGGGFLAGCGGVCFASAAPLLDSAAVLGAVMLLDAVPVVTGGGGCGRGHVSVEWAFALPAPVLEVALVVLVVWGPLTVDAQVALAAGGHGAV